MASELALALAELVEDCEAFPNEAVHDLHALLGHGLAVPDRAAYRWDLLHALVTLLRERHGEPPTAAEYKRAREARFPDAPAASTLAERYGTWLKALEAASRLPRMSLTSPVPTQAKHWHAPYTPEEIAAALAQYRKRWGEWPRPSEYRPWSETTKRARRNCGAPDPGLPSMNIMYQRFGTFDKAVAFAQQIHEAF